jgi:hypothetical protein
MEHFVMSQELQTGLQTGSRQRDRRSIYGSLTILCGGLIAALAFASDASAAHPVGTFRGSVYGAAGNAKAGPAAATLGRAAVIGCPCQGTGGKVVSNRVTSISAGQNGKVLSIAAIIDSVSTNSGSSSASVKNSSTVRALDVLNGLITADAAVAVANTAITGSAITSSSNGTKFVGLRVAGRTFPGTVPANTHVDLPGIGNVIINREVKGGNGTSSGVITIDMLVINITEQNSLGLPVGAQIILGHASSGFKRSLTRAALGGVAYAAQGNSKVGLQLENLIGQAASVSVPCDGTGSKATTNSSAALKASAVLSFAAGDTTAFGGLSNGITVAKTTAKVDGVSLLNGLIVAGKVTAVAEEGVRSNGNRTRSTSGSGFAGLKVLGLSLPNTVAANTRRDLPGIGYVILNQQTVPSTASSAAMVVNGMHLYVTTLNLLGLGVGSEIIVAHATAQANPIVGLAHSAVASTR